MLARVDPNRSRGQLDEARSEVAVMTHHDAITGTSPQKTADDYYKRLHNAYAASKSVIQTAYHYLKDKQKGSSEVFCDQLNVTECSVSESNDKVAVTIYNPIARSVSEYVTVPVGGGNYKVYDSAGKQVNGALLPVPDGVKRLPERRSSASQELVFKAQLPALGFNTYFVEKSKILESNMLLHHLFICL